jgi:hypothetical protein
MHPFSNSPTVQLAEHCDHPVVWEQAELGLQEIRMTLRVASCCRAISDSEASLD